MKKPAAAVVFLGCVMRALPALALDAVSGKVVHSPFWDVVYYSSIAAFFLFIGSLAYVLRKWRRKSDRILAASEHENRMEREGPFPVEQGEKPDPQGFSALKTVDPETGKISYDMHPVAHSRTEVGTFAYLLALGGIAGLLPVFGLLPGIATLVLAPLAARRFRPSLERVVGIKLILFSVVAAGAGALASLLSSLAYYNSDGVLEACVPVFPGGSQETPIYFPFVLLGVLVFSVIIHECAHGLVAFWCGDPTAKNAGRLTLNPAKHFSFFGSFILPAMLLLITQFNVALGYARPVPIDMSRFGRQRRDRIFAATAGVTANFMLAAISLSLLTGLAFSIGSIWPKANITNFSNFLGVPDMDIIPGGWMLAPFVQVLKSVFVVNIVLGCLNLVPIPSLDGSFVLESFLKGNLRFYFRILRRLGFVILAILLFILIYTGVFGYLLAFVIKTCTLIRFVTHLN